MSTIDALSLASALFVVWFTMRAYRDTGSAAGRQTARQAIIEVWIGIIIGFTLNLALNRFLLPLVGAKIDSWSNFQLGIIFTSVSVLRTYAIRRWADASIHEFAEWLSMRLTLGR